MYRKNVASQSVWAQMNATADGAALTTGVTVKVAYAGNYGDGAGACTHRGGGLWEYVFDQAETNHDQFGYQFNHATGVSKGGTIIPTAANPTDAVRFGLTALPNAAADAAGGLPISDAGGLDLDAIKTRTDTIALVSSITGAVVTDAGNGATSFKTNLSSAVNDFYKDCLLVITSGALAGQVKKITTYNGTSKVVTVGALTSTPADGVTFAVINK
jgi:hypothetical protein